MIFTASVIDGFKVVLGSLPLQIGMLFTTLCTVPIPKFEDKLDTECLYTYIMLCTVHFLMFLQIAINHYYASSIPNISAITNIFLMMVQVITQINLCVNWVFYAHPNAAWIEERSDESWTKFNNWIHIEVLVFAGYLVSAITFNLIRCFKSEVVYL